MTKNIITLDQFIKSCETLGIPYWVYDKDKDSRTYESLKGGDLPYKYPEDATLLDYALCGAGMCAVVGTHTNYCVYVNDMDMHQDGDLYVDSLHSSDLRDVFDTPDKALALMRELVDQYSDEWRVERKGKGLDTITYQNVSVEKEVLDVEGEPIESRCKTIASCDAMPESVRKKAEEAERRYHAWLDYKCEDYWKSGIIYGTTSEEE